MVVTWCYFLYLRIVTFTFINVWRNSNQLDVWTKIEYNCKKKATSTCFQPSSLVWPWWGGSCDEEVGRGAETSLVLPLLSSPGSPLPILLSWEALREMQIAWVSSWYRESFKLYLCHLLSPAPPPLPRTSLNKASSPFTSLEASSSIASHPPAFPGEGLGLLDEGGDPRLRKHHDN